MNRAAQQLGRLGGKKTSEAKATAARANGKLGGRPKKTPKAKKRPPSEANAVALPTASDQPPNT